MRIGLVSSYPPRRCGIGTFSHDLWTGLKLVNGEDSAPVVVAMNTPALIAATTPSTTRTAHAC